MMVLLVLVIFMVLWVGVIWYNGHMLTLPLERVAHRRTGFGLSSGCG